MNKYGKASVPFLFIIDFEVKNILLYKDADTVNDHVYYDLNGVANTNTIEKPKGYTFYFQKNPMKFDDYKSAFIKIQQHIGHGNTYLINLTFPTPISTNLSLSDIFQFSRARYKLLYQNKFVVFSPEAFVQIKNNQIASYPMKGTISASVRNAKNTLLNDNKELAEHNTIVDLIRNDLSMVSKNVRVEKFRFIDIIKTHEKEILQTSSKIVGDLPHDWKEQIGDILFKLLPAGSISGAPKKKTVEIIKEVEGYERGFFTGVFGYFDGNSLDSAVMIRFIENMNGRLLFKSGGGITNFSDCEKEYRELIDKVYVPVV